MFIDSIELENVRTFAAKKKIEFVHPDKHLIDDSPEYQEMTFNNVNLIFGDNASGKTTLLEAIAMSALGPTAEASRVAPRPLVRFVPGSRKPSTREKKQEAHIAATLVLHGEESIASAGQDGYVSGTSELCIRSRGELESYEFVEQNDTIEWEESWHSDNDSFFVVAYGATRRIEQKMDIGHRKKSSRFQRASRLESVMEEGYPLVPMQSWLSRRKKDARWKQLVNLIDSLMGKDHFSFEGKVNEEGDFLFTKGGIDVPFRSLSDGYRSFLGWTTDLLHHLDAACPEKEKDLSKVSGVVLVDEIDLHLHPKWQMTVIETLSKTFPRLQFIFTSHSPLIAGSVQWMNVVHLHLDRQHRTGVDRFEESIHGLDADQILVSSLFGLKSTRANAKRDELHDLTIKARRGDKGAAKDLISAMAKGLEVRK